MNFIARVKKLEKINDAVFELTLVHDNDLFYFSAGQYVWIENKYGRRAFSISSSSTNPKELKILFKTGIESDYMKFMSILKIGDTLTLIGPRGTLRIPDTQSKSVYLSGGVGITPFLSILRSLKDKNISRDITLVSVNSNESVELYKDELLQMANNDSQLKIVYLQGKLKKDDLIKINNSNKESDWYIIGSQSFVDNASTLLGELDVKGQKIFFEENFPSVPVINLDSNKNDFFKKITDQSAIHIVITDSNGVIKYANIAAEKTTGYKISEMIGNTPRLWGGLMDKDVYRKFWKTIKDERKVYIGEFTNMKITGEKYDVLATVSPIIEKGILVGYIGMEQDITEDKKTKNELKKIKDLMIDRFLEKNKK